MSLLSRLFAKRSSPENPRTPLSNPDKWLVDLLGGLSDAGVNVTPHTAINLCAVWQAVFILSGDFAKLPLNVYQRTANDGRRKATEHPAWRLLRRKPNREMTAGVFKRTLAHHLLLWGNAYAYVYRDAAARPIEIVPLLPDRTHPVRNNGVLRYVTRVDGEPRELLPENVLHLRGLSFDGLTGLSVVTAAKQSIALGLATEKFGNKFFANGSRASGILTYPGRLKPQAADNLREEFEEKHQGLDNSHRTILLQEGAKFTPLTIPPDDAQFLGTRDFQKRDIAGWFNLPPHKLGDATRVSYNSLEQENQSYLDSSLDPLLLTGEEEADDKLLTEEQKRSDSHFIEFNRAALLRTDLQTRYACYAIGRQWGWLSVNRILQKENEEPIGPQGDVFLIPQNMIPADKADQLGPAKPAAPAAEPADDERAAKLKEAHCTIITDTAARMLRRVAQTARGAAKHSDFADRIDGLLAGYEDVFRDAMSPSVVAVRTVTGDDTLSPHRIARKHVEALRRDLTAACDGPAEQLAARVDACAKHWESNGATEFAAYLLGA